MNCCLTICKFHFQVSVGFVRHMAMALVGALHVFNTFAANTWKLGGFTCTNASMSVFTRLGPATDTTQEEDMQLEKKINKNEVAEVHLTEDEEKDTEDICLLDEDGNLDSERNDLELLGQAAITDHWDAEGEISNTSGNAGDSVHAENKPNSESPQPTCTKKMDKIVTNQSVLHKEGMSTDEVISPKDTSVDDKAMLTDEAILTDHVKTIEPPKMLRHPEKFLNFKCESDVEMMEIHTSDLDKDESLTSNAPITNVGYQEPSKFRISDLFPKVISNYSEKNEPEKANCGENSAGHSGVETSVTPFDQGLYLLQKFKLSPWNLAKIKPSDAVLINSYSSSLDKDASIMNVALTDIGKVSVF